MNDAVALSPFLSEPELLHFPDYPLPPPQHSTALSTTSARLTRLHSEPAPEGVSHFVTSASTVKDMPCELPLSDARFRSSNGSAC